MLRPGDQGADVLALQKQLVAQGFWLGTADGTYGGLTQQAVLAAQKSSGLSRDGIAGASTRAAVADGIRVTARGGGNRIEIDLTRQILLIVRDGRVQAVLNTSTGNGEHFTEKGYSGVAVTPPGHFVVRRQYDGSHVGPLGALWRPKYFNGGIAVHGAPYIPGYPASHGCARVSNAAINMIWAQGYMPIGSPVHVYR